ncbi:unnamed protein product [Protopolystoma xenopodis]|uniref:Protein kinase domain-containing protein n=1 Tax=Protopolystoma xenopodis TaxID=117903 RepID=A0A3S5CNL0_9PLAT|nr:unnamed protein product [Protopolystoma xenopodis]
MISFCNPTQSSGGGEYGFEADWWALGVLVYEMLFAETPFYSETLVSTYSKIMSHSQSLHFPTDAGVSDEVIDFMGVLLTDASVRLGSRLPEDGADVLEHPWFSHAWAKLHRRHFMWGTGKQQNTDSSIPPSGDTENGQDVRPRTNKQEDGE